MKKYAGIGAVLALVALTLVAVTPSSAATTSSQSHGQWREMGEMMRHRPHEKRGVGIVGQVTAMSGSSITITSRGMGTTTASTTYTVDASNATIMKNNATSTVSSISVGDRILVQGTVSGTSVTATVIRDIGVLNTRTEGNGEPIIAGKIATVNGSTLTIANNSGTTYTIDASSATIKKAGVISANVSNISVGDVVIAQGTINGTSMTASSVLDRSSALHEQLDEMASTTPREHPAGFFGGVGNFFRHLFSF